MIIGDFRRSAVWAAAFFVGVFLPFAIARSRPLPAKKTVIVALGDSTTAGTPFFRSPIEAPPDGRGEEEGQYSYWMMKQKPNWDVLNFGVAGQTSSEIRDRMPEAIKRSPRFIVVFAGVNDIVQNTPVSRISDNLLWMYKQAKAASIMPVAVTVLPFDIATPEQAAAIDSLNGWIKKQADELRIPFVDANAAARDANDPHKLSGSTDQLHPDIGGYRSIAKKMVEAIEPVEKAWR